MTAVTSKMSRMVMLYMLILSMVSLPTSLARLLLVETAGNQGGDDYHWSPPRLPPPSGGSDYQEPKPELNLGHFTLDQFEKGELSMIPLSFIPILSTVETFHDLILMPHHGDMIYRSNYWMTEPNCLPTISHFSLSQLVIISLVIFRNIYQCCCRRGLRTPLETTYKLLLVGL